MEPETLKFFCRGEGLELGHSRRNRVTPEPLRFAFPSGKLVALVGRNGAGKSTLLRAFLGDPVILAGDVFLGNHKDGVSRLKPLDLAREVAFVPQEQPFPTEVSLVDFLRLAYLPKMGVFGQTPPEAEQEVPRLLAAFHLETLATRSLRHLSTGERQKAFLARALLQKPRYLFLDEPTNHLDPGAVFSFWRALLEQRRQSALECIVSTHDLAFVRRHAEWICALETGCIAFQGPATSFWEAGWPARLFGQILLD